MPPPVPRTADQVAWTAWSLNALGLWTEDRKLRRIEWNCIDQLKKDGVIR